MREWQLESFSAPMALMTGRKLVDHQTWTQKEHYFSFLRLHQNEINDYRYLPKTEPLMEEGCPFLVACSKDASPFVSRQVIHRMDPANGWSALGNLSSAQTESGESSGARFHSISHVGRGSLFQYCIVPGVALYF